MRPFALLVVTILSSGAFAQPPRPAAPPPPAEYDIDIRFRIDAFRNERAVQMKDFLGRLKALGFDPGYDLLANDRVSELVEDVRITRLKGKIKSARLRDVLTLRPVLNVLIQPAGVALPMGKVRVDLELASALGPVRQRELVGKVVQILGSEDIGFSQPIGYDDRGNRRLLGILPVDKLEILVKDIRRTKAAWQLLPKSLLNDLRNVSGGPATLGTVLNAWNAHPEGEKLMLATLDAWVVTEPAYRLVNELPPLVVNEPTLLRQVRNALQNRAAINKETQDRLRALVRKNEPVREQLIGQLQSEPRSASLLEKLLEQVFKSPAGPELMDMLLRRVEGRNTAVALPQLFRDRVLIRVIEVQVHPDLPLPELPPKTPEIAAAVVRVAPGLRELLDDEAQKNNTRRIEVVLNFTPDLGTRWQEPLLKVVPGLLIEGRLGSVLTVRCTPVEAAALGRVLTVASVRLPRQATSAVLRLPEEEGDEKEVLKTTGIAELLRQGKPERPVRIAVIDSDFRGWEPLVRKKDPVEQANDPLDGKKRLPYSTRLIDLTSERNEDLTGDVYPDAPAALGSGTLMALAVARAAPWCELILIRIDAGSPYMVRLIHGRLNGRSEYGDSLQARRLIMEARRLRLNNESRKLQAERLRVLKLFVDEDVREKDVILKARQAQMAKYRKDQADYDADEKQFQELEKVYLRYITDLRELRDVRLVVCGLSWTDGLPVDGGSALSRQLDDTEGGRYLWIQAVGNTRGQAWTGLFRDVEGNGVMEFADDRTKRPADNWSHELAFLAWQPFKGERSKLLPANTKVRITLQWRETHDPEFSRSGDDPFRLPLNDLRLMVMRQPDPEGKKQPADDVGVYGGDKKPFVTVGPPQRIAVEDSSAVFEHVLEMTVEAAARLALRVEGSAATSTRPRGTLELPMDRRTAELKPRIFIQTLGDQGRVVFESYATTSGEIGVPADASRAYTVGALDAKKKPQPYGIQGTPYNLELSRRPELSTFDRLGLEGTKSMGGSGMAAGLVGGYAASLLGHGTRWEDLLGELRRRLPK